MGDASCHIPLFVTPECMIAKLKVSESDKNCVLRKIEKALCFLLQAD